MWWPVSAAQSRGPFTQGYRVTGIGVLWPRAPPETRVQTRPDCGCFRDPRQAMVGNCAGKVNGTPRVEPSMPAGESGPLLCRFLRGEVVGWSGDMDGGAPLILPPSPGQGIWAWAAEVPPGLTLHFMFISGQAEKTSGRSFPGSLTQARSLGVRGRLVLTIWLLKQFREAAGL